MDSKLNFLIKCNKNTKRFTFDGKVVEAKVVACYDGDTISLVFIPHERSEPCLFSCRCSKYNSAEIKSKNEEERKKAIESRDYLRDRILNKIVKAELGKFDKYGRILTIIYYEGININDEMIEKGYGKQYDGFGPKIF